MVRGLDLMMNHFSELPYSNCGSWDPGNDVPSQNCFYIMVFFFFTCIINIVAFNFCFFQCFRHLSLGLKRLERIVRSCVLSVVNT